MASSSEFWRKHSIGKRSQPGNPHAANEMPSRHIKMSSEKAKKILEHGEVRGHPLTEAQKGMFGAIAGKKKK